MTESDAGALASKRIAEALGETEADQVKVARLEQSINATDKSTDAAADSNGESESDSDDDAVAVELRGSIQLMEALKKRISDVFGEVENSVYNVYTRFNDLDVEYKLRSTRAVLTMMENAISSATAVGDAADELHADFDTRIKLNEKSI